MDIPNRMSSKRLSLRQRQTRREAVQVAQQKLSRFTDSSAVARKRIVAYHRIHISQALPQRSCKKDPISFAMSVRMGQPQNLRRDFH